jgi:hypothetical protein
MALLLKSSRNARRVHLEFHTYLLTIRPFYFMAPIGPTTSCEDERLSALTKC